MKRVTEHQQTEVFLVGMENLITLSVIVLLAIHTARISMKIEDRKGDEGDLMCDCDNRRDLELLDLYEVYGYFFQADQNRVTVKLKDIDQNIAKRFTDQHLKKTFQFMFAEYELDEAGYDKKNRKQSLNFKRIESDDR